MFNSSNKNAVNATSIKVERGVANSTFFAQPAISWRVESKKFDQDIVATASGPFSLGPASLDSNMFANKGKYRVTSFPESNVKSGKEEVNEFKYKTKSLRNSGPRPPVSFTSLIDDIQPKDSTTNAKCDFSCMM